MDNLAHLTEYVTRFRGGRIAGEGAIASERRFLVAAIRRSREKIALRARRRAATSGGKKRGGGGARSCTDRALMLFA